MNTFEETFYALPDTVIITDTYWYILDFNQTIPFKGLRKGENLSRYIPDCRTVHQGTLLYKDEKYHRSITSIQENGVCTGYVVHLVDVTEMEQLIEARRAKSKELQELIQRQVQANEELEGFVRQAEALRTYEEALRVARSIHDDAGHVITELNTLSQMCLLLKDSDPEQYVHLLDEGIAICKRLEKQRAEQNFTSVRQMLETFRDENPFPVMLAVSGKEPEFAPVLYEVILRICREAYHNTLSHSLGDRLTINVCMGSEFLTLRLFDNGVFRGVLEKGFGLTMMEENVRKSGGVISFEADKGQGFEILVEWRGNNERKNQDPSGG